MTAGMAVLLLDGCAKGIAFSVQGLKFRSVDEPSGEGNLARLPRKALPDPAAGSI